MDAPTEASDWIGEALETEAVNGRRYGYDQAWSVVTEIVTELYAAGDPKTARLIHQVWKRIDAEREARLQRKS